MPSNFLQNSEKTKPKWIICQIGAREHYIIATELARRGLLNVLYTDIWSKPLSSWHLLSVILNWLGYTNASSRLKGRFSQPLARAKIVSWSLASEIGFKLSTLFHHPGSRRGNWPTIIRRNKYFARRVVKHLKRSRYAETDDHSKTIIFAYSYAALEVISLAKRSGSKIILGQIDGGPEGDRIIREIGHMHFPDMKFTDAPPLAYWQDWHKECVLADAIIVNSQWSAKLLANTNVDNSKIHIIPLAYNARSKQFPAKIYPQLFTSQRPLKILFLGQVSIGKGVIELLQAMERLEGAPVRLSIVGPAQANIIERYPDLKQVDWLGSSPRSEISTHYSNADIFILPTHSDGFGLTQLEAQAHALPVLASPFCGEVVKDGINGRIIDEVSPQAIENVIRWAIENPSKLSTMSIKANQRIKDFSPEKIMDKLIDLVESLPN